MTEGPRSAAGPPEEGEPYLGDAIDFFLSAKRAGGRSEKTIDEYRKKLDLFQRWAAEWQVEEAMDVLEEEPEKFYKSSLD